ncbi:MAG: GGDEF domain-containing protein [Treponema sp.]|nr:GGDEF domain-containing protein [Treponema sp.]
MTDFVRIQHENATTKEVYEKMKSSGIIYTNIAKTLARSYIDLYYVNLETGNYIEYLPGEKGNALEAARSGDDFFESLKIDAEQFVHPDDEQKVISALDKQTLIDYLNENETFIMTYRLLSKDGTISSGVTDKRKAIYVNMKISRMENDERFAIIGISDVDAEVKSRRALERMKEESIVYNRLSALAGEFICVYIVVPETGYYREYSATEEFNAHAISKEGLDFFATSRKEITRVIYKKDLERFMALFTEENVMSEIEQKGFFSLSYRLMLNDTPTYVQLKAVIIQEKEGPRLIVGVTNIDTFMRQEREYAKRLAQARKTAGTDALTGLKNKHAYLNEEERMDKRIAENERPEFAIVVLDVNNLKTVNDTQGHQAGDQLICNASKTICDIFKHSPVFRVGGDEFAVIAQDEDYAHIDDLIEKMNAHNEEALRTNGIIIACGMAKYAADASVATVYERADQNMYENKSSLKSKKA